MCVEMPTPVESTVAGKVSGRGIHLPNIWTLDLQGLQMAF